MRVEFIELLRCPASHELSALITVAHRRDGDHLIEATLGCSVCGADYVLDDGIVDLRLHSISALASHAGAPAPSDAAPASSRGTADPLRIAALLSLGDATARALLCGHATVVAEQIETLTGARCVSINPDRRIAAAAQPVDAITLSPSERIPFATASLTGLAVDAAHLSLLTDATRVVRRGGRILAPAHAPIPFGCTELARDEHEWVAEVHSATSAPVTLQRAAGPHP